MGKNLKIKGVVFKHEGKDDYSIWMPDLTKNEEKRLLQTLVAIYSNNGTSVRGTKEEILQAIAEDL